MAGIFPRKPGQKLPVRKRTRWIEIVFLTWNDYINLKIIRITFQRISGSPQSWQQISTNYVYLTLSFIIPIKALVMNRIEKNTRIFSWLFLSTGIFAIVGALYTWGDGPITAQADLLPVLVPWGDLLITGPISLLAAYGVSKRKSWGQILGLMVCGIYIFGSGLVYITLAWNGAPYPLHLALPPLAGIAIGISFPIWVLSSYIGFPYPLISIQSRKIFTPDPSKKVITR